MSDGLAPFADLVDGGGDLPVEGTADVVGGEEEGGGEEDSEGDASLGGGHGLVER